MNREALIHQLDDHEGFRPYAYQDSQGYWTIGIGRLIDRRRGGGITRAEAEYLLSNDVAEVEKQLDAWLPWWKDEDDVRQRVLADLCFNLGIAGLMGFPHTLVAWREHHYEEAARHLEDSEWFRQVGRRGPRLVAMLRTGKDL